MRLGAVVAGLACVVAVAAGGAEQPRPNVLFLVADDLATRLGCYGDAAAITPNLDRLAKSGVLFTHAYAQGSVCTPSRTAFMLGLNNAHAGANHFQKHPDTMTLGRWFRTHGYHTFSVGKIDHTEEYLDPQAWDIHVPYADLKPTRGLGGLTKLQEDEPQPDGTSLRRNFSHFGVGDGPEQMHDAQVADRAIEFLATRRDASKPFFAAVGFHSPHVPWNTLRSSYDAHARTKFSPEKTPADATTLPAGSLHYEPPLAVSDDLAREAMHAYYAAVSLLDAEVGRILTALDAQGLCQDTVVVFTSDHGYHLGWRGQWVKHTISEQVLNVPLIVRAPGAVAGAKADGIVELIDLFPTFCDLAGIAKPDHLDGTSFQPLLRNPASAGKPAAFIAMPKGWGNGRSVRTVRFRYVERNDGSVELYDHASDPDEYHNVAADPAHAAVIREHAVLLEQTFGPRKARQERRRAG
jgi:arylsulfatase A-like enzyme